MRRSGMGVAAAIALSALVAAACGKGDGPSIAEHEALVKERSMRIARATEALVQRTQAAAKQDLQLVEKLARDPAMLAAVRGDSAAAVAAFVRFTTGDGIAVVVTTKGKVAARRGVDTPDPKHPYLARMLAAGDAGAATVVDYGQVAPLGLARIAIAPVIDDQVGSLAGAVVIATRLDLRKLSDELAVEIAVFGDKLEASSLNVQDAAVRDAIAGALDGSELREQARAHGQGGPELHTLAGAEYVLATALLPRVSDRRLRADYPAPAQLAVVLTRVSSRR